MTVQYVDEVDTDLFELVLGSDDGRIFMRTIQIEDVSAQDIKLEEVISSEINTNSFMSI